MKNKLKSSLLAGAAALFLLSPTWKESGLKEIAKPYLGVYHCTKAQLGKKDLLGKTSRFQLELKDGEYILYYQEKEGDTQKVEGKYEYDTEKKVLRLLDDSKGLKREFPFAAGKLTVAFPIGKEEILLQFERK